MVGLTGFSDKKMSGLLFGPQKSGRNNGVPLYDLLFIRDIMTRLFVTLNVDKSYGVTITNETSSTELSLTDYMYIF